MTARPSGSSSGSASCSPSSTSSNPNEAALAAEKAVELAQRHNLDLARIDGRPADPYVERSCDVGGASQWRWLADVGRRAGQLLPGAAPPRGRAAAASMFVIGEPHNVAVCEFLFAYLAREVERLADAAGGGPALVYGEHVEVRSWKNDFRRGAVATIDGRLREPASCSPRARPRPRRWCC